MPATQIPYGFVPGQLILFIAILVGSGLFLRDASRLFKMLQLGLPANRTDQPGLRTKGWVTHVIGQARLLTRTYPGVMHALIFWGFLVITLGTIEQFFRGLTGFPLPLVSGNPAFMVLVDLFQLLVLVGIARALYRRIFVKPWYLNLSGDAIIILSLITTLMVTAFLWEAFLVVGDPNPAHQAEYRWWLIGSGIAGAF